MCHCWTALPMYVLESYVGRVDPCGLEVTTFVSTRICGVGVGTCRVLRAGAWRARVQLGAGQLQVSAVL